MSLRKMHRNPQTFIKTPEYEQVGAVSRHRATYIAHAAVAVFASAHLPQRHQI